MNLFPFDVTTTIALDSLNMSKIEVRLMRLEDEAGGLELMWHFYRNDPFTRGLDIDRGNEPKLYFDALFMPCLEDGMCAVAVDITNGQAAGMALASVMHKGLPDKIRFAEDEPESRNMANDQACLSSFYKDLDLYRKYDVDKQVNLRILSVTEKYQRQGIGAKLVQKVLELSRRKDIRLVTAEATSAFSAKIFQKLGFEKLVERSYDSVTIGNNPVRLPDVMKEIHKTVAVYAKQY